MLTYFNLDDKYFNIYLQTSKKTTTTMKKYLLTITTLLFIGLLNTAAQEKKDVWFYGESVSLGVFAQYSDFRNAAFNNEGYIGYYLKINYPIMLHSKPILGNFKFAIDAGIMADYGRMKEEEVEKDANGNFWNDIFDDDDDEDNDDDDGDDKSYEVRLELAHLGLRIGPSLVYKLPKAENAYINLYAHVIPSLSVLKYRSNFSFSHASYMGVGIRGIYEEIGIGIEYLHGWEKHRNFKPEILSDMYEYVPVLNRGNKYDIVTKSLRLHLLYMF